MTVTKIASTQVMREITATEAGDRLDHWLQTAFPESSRSMLQRLIREEHVLLRGESTTPKTPVRIGDIVSIRFPPAIAALMEPEDIPLIILFEDEHLLVLNKAAGFVVHPGAGHASHTLVHALLHHCRGQLSGIGGIERPGIVHRLDKDTTGCLAVAKTDRVHRKMVEMFQARTISKTYLAVVWGTPRMLSGRIDKAIGRHATHRSKMTLREDGRAALTEWKIRQKFEGRTLIECKLHTGRTHQIRVHLSSIGHPIAGDVVYGRPPFGQVAPARQLLHAWKLSFEHPVHKTLVSCEAPMPPDMQGLS